jgi:protein-L-isoaspartate(D-aspartate) O-methyltransferase
MLARVILGPLRRKPVPPDARLKGRQAALIAKIEAEVEATSGYLGKDRLEPRVMAALAGLRREEFLPPELAELAYENAPLAIGHGQTISQPYIVAVMTDMLAPRPEDVLLEIGSGSGYQTALLAELVARVYSIERLPELATEAAARLARLGYRNVELREGDGALGWPEHAPYDGIIVTAAAAQMPQALIRQLKPGRRLVLPLGPPGGQQELIIVEKSATGAVSERVTLPVAFVPLLSAEQTSVEPMNAEAGSVP